MSHVPEFSITELSQSFQVTPRTLRHYDDCGLIRSHRNASNRRRFAQAERERLEFILQLRRGDLGLTAIAKILQSADDQGEIVAIGRACDALEERRTALSDRIEANKTVTTVLRKRLGGADRT